SVNGLREARGRERVANLSLNSGRQFQIGHTVLRYADCNHTVAPAALDRTGVLSHLASPYVGLAAGVLVLVFLVLDSFFGSYERLNVAKSLTESVTTLSMVLVWAGSWALVSRIVFGRFFYMQHFALACAAIVVSMIVHTAAEWIEFFLPISQALWIAAVIGGGMIFAALVYGHLGLASVMRRRSRLWAGLGVSAAVIGVGVIADYANRNTFSTAMEYSAVLKPIDAALVPASSVDRFMVRTEKLKKELSILAQKAKSAQP
ncbi:MAG: hypothetical protein ACREQO_00460, partial [Candidatus Binatia bacterium]